MISKSICYLLAQVVQTVLLPAKRGDGRAKEGQA